MTLWACLNIYNEKDLLQGCIDSIRDVLKDVKICAIDGAYELFNIQSKILAAMEYEKGQSVLAECFLRFSMPDSSDGTLEILEKNKIDVIIKANGKAWKNEYEKRSQYLSVGQDGDWMVVIDGDERLRGRFDPRDVNGSDDWCISLKRDDNIPPYPILRVHKYEKGMRYYGAHHALWRGDRLVKRGDIENNWVLPNCWLDHRWSERGNMDQVRHMGKGAYYRQLLQDEDAFRKEHGI